MSPEIDVIHDVSHDKGIFVLVKTSNKSSGELQDKKFSGGGTLYENMGELIEKLSKDSVGKYGYSRIGAVVGATYKERAAELRQKLKHTFFLIPGYGAQGGTAQDLKVCFDSRKLGGIVNNSRGILTAYKGEKYKNMTYQKAARQAALDMQKDIWEAL